MRTTIRTTLALAALVPALQVLPGQTLTVASGRPIGTVSREPTDVTAKEIARINARIADADAIIEAGRFAEARVVLHEVLVSQARSGLYVGPTLRRLANVEFSLSRPLAAAKVLEDLADAAKGAGDPQAEVDALADAMITYIQVGRKSKASALKGRVRKLLEDPKVSDETRRSLMPYVM